MASVATPPSAEIASDPAVSGALQQVPGGASMLAAPSNAGEEDQLVNSAAAALPVEVEVGVPVREFRVRNLLALEPGQVIESQWSHVEDVPLGAGKVQLAWSEFEVLDAQMAVRVTRLA